MKKKGITDYLYIYYLFYLSIVKMTFDNSNFATNYINEENEKITWLILNTKWSKIIINKGSKKNYYGLKVYLFISYEL